MVCCEDTRRTRALLTASGVPGAGRLVSLHEHNEAARIPEVLGWVAQGRTVAVVTDAGTPAVSDPGARLVAAAAGAGAPVTVVPGPSAVLAALVVSGLPTDRFCVEGFLPRKGAERRRRLEALVAERRTCVVLEAPGRLAATLGDLAAALGDRPVAVVRELTKVHEEVWRGGLVEAAGHYGAVPVRGEVVVVVGGAPERRGAHRPAGGRRRWPSGWPPGTACARPPTRWPPRSGCPGAAPTARRSTSGDPSARGGDRPPGGG